MLALLVSVALAGQCIEGRVPTGKGCCWEGQSWEGDATGNCVGIPTSCPTGKVVTTKYGCVDESQRASFEGEDTDLGGGVGGLIGAKGTAIGVGGLGSRGEGTGGGGTALGLGGLGTGSGTSPTTATLEPIILGAMDRAEVDRVVNRYLPQIRYCYESALAKQPALAGKVNVKFVISKDGTVSSAVVKSTTLNHADTESCVTGHFARMQFPAPRGGGIVIVSYPFAFAP